MSYVLLSFPLQLAIGRVLISYFSAKRQMKLDTELWSGRRDVTLSFVSLINNENYREEINNNKCLEIGAVNKADICLVCSAAPAQSYCLQSVFSAKLLRLIS